MTNDPYTSPLSPIQSVPPNGTAGGVSAGVVDQLARTKPWVRLFSVLMFLGAGLMLLVAAAILLVGGIGAAGSKGSTAAISGAMGVGISMVYAVMAVLYIFPALKLWKYASGIGRLLYSGSEGDLVNALNEQRVFWKFVGILMISMIALYFIAIIVMMVFAVGMAPHAKPTNF